MDGCMDAYIYIYMVSNGYRWRRYDNLIQHKHVTVYAKVQVMQQRYMPSRCHQVPRLPRETKVDVSKCHACHANSRGVPAFHSGPSAPPEPAQCHTCHACHAKSGSRCRQVPRLPSETKMDVSKCHACHANSRGVPAPHLKPSAPPEPAQCHKCHACHAKVEVDVTKYHACHVKRRWMSPSATPATPTAAASRRQTWNQARHQSQPSAISATPATPE